MLEHETDVYGICEIRTIVSDGSRSHISTLEKWQSSRVSAELGSFVDSSSNSMSEASTSHKSSRSPASLSTSLQIEDQTVLECRDTKFPYPNISPNVILTNIQCLAIHSNSDDLHLTEPKSTLATDAQSNDPGFYVRCSHQ